MNRILFKYSFKKLAFPLVSIIMKIRDLYVQKEG